MEAYVRHKKREILDKLIIKVIYDLAQSVTKNKAGVRNIRKKWSMYLMMNFWVPRDFKNCMQHSKTACRKCKMSRSWYFPACRIRQHIHTLILKPIMQSDYSKNKRNPESIWQIVVKIVNDRKEGDDLLESTRLVRDPRQHPTVLFMQMVRIVRSRFLVG